MGRNLSFTKLWATLFPEVLNTLDTHLDKIFYAFLISPGQCDHAGLTRLTLRGWLEPLGPATEDDLRASLVRLEKAGRVYTDWDTEEVLARELMVRDELGRQPNMMINAARAAALVRSPKLAKILLAEFARADIAPSTDAKVQARLDAALLAAEEHLRARAALLPVSGEPFAEPFSGPADNPSERPDSEPFREGFGEGCVSVSVRSVNSRLSFPPVEKLDHLRRPSNVAAPTPPQPPPTDPDPGRQPPPPQPAATTPPPALPAPTAAVIPLCGPECATRPCGRCADTARVRTGCNGHDRHGYRIEPADIDIALAGLPAIVCDHTPWSIDDWYSRAGLVPPTSPAPYALMATLAPPAPSDSHIGASTALSAAPAPLLRAIPDSDRAPAFGDVHPREPLAAAG